MGRKKSSRKPTTYIKQKLETQFSCLFCNHERSVICSMDKKTLIGSLKCKVCGQKFQTTITVLSAPIDVYSDWVDVCEEINDKKANGEYDDENENEYRRSAVEVDDDEDYDDSD